MAYQMKLQMITMICPETGRPFYYDENEVKNFDLSSLRIPDGLTKYTKVKGDFLIHYIDRYKYMNRGTSLDIDQVLQVHPLWDDIEEHFEEEASWTKEDHVSLTILFEWCKKQKVQYRISWSK